MQVRCNSRAGFGKVLKDRKYVRAARCRLWVLLLYFPGSTLSKVNVIELTLPESWRLRFSPWRLTDCSVTSRSPQVSAERRQEGLGWLPSPATAQPRTLHPRVLLSTAYVPKGSDSRLPFQPTCICSALRRLPCAGHQCQTTEPPMVKATPSSVAQPRASTEDRRGKTVFQSAC